MSGRVSGKKERTYATVACENGHGRLLHALKICPACALLDWAKGQQVMASKAVEELHRMKPKVGYGSLGVYMECSVHDVVMSRLKQLAIRDKRKSIFPDFQAMRAIASELQELADTASRWAADYEKAETLERAEQKEKSA